MPAAAATSSMGASLAARAISRSVGRDTWAIVVVTDPTVADTAVSDPGPKARDVAGPALKGQSTLGRQSTTAWLRTARGRWPTRAGTTSPLGPTAKTRPPS